MGLDPGLRAARGQAPGRLPARRRRLLRRSDRPPEPALHGPAQRPPRRRGRGGHRRGPRAGRPDRPGRRPGRARTRAACASGSASPTPWSSRPDLLILDEPTTSIDPLGVVEILDLLRRLVQDRGLAILLSSHLLSQVQSVCDRIGIFAAGRLIGVGTVDELASQFGDGSAAIEVGLELPTAAEVERRRASCAASHVGRDGRSARRRPVGDVADRRSARADRGDARPPGDPRRRGRATACA